jgi:hypothetical protein
VESSADLILVIVEGPTDKAFLENLCRRLKFPCKVLIMRGNRPEKAARLIRTFNARKKFVLKDLHCLNPDFVERIKNELRRLDAHVVPVRHSVEAWILAGLGMRSAENLMDPEEELKRRGIMKTPGKYGQLAGGIDIDLAMKYSSSFSEFLTKMRDP